MRVFLIVLLFLSDTKVYAALGNHDFHPKNQFPAESNSIYNQVAELWRPWFNNESFAVFREGINDACYHMGTDCMSGGVWSNFVFTTSPEIDTDFCPHFTEEETETEVTQLGKLRTGSGTDSKAQSYLIRAARMIVSQQVPGTILSTLLEPLSNPGRALGTFF